MRSHGLSAMSIGFAVILAFSGVQAGADPAAAGPLAADSVRGQGEFTNDAGLMIDGSTVPEGTEWINPACVNWSDPGVSFTLDLGREQTVTGLFAQLDNNDNYVFEASVDGAEWMPLVTVPWDLGTVESGMESFSTEPGDPDYVAGLEFQPKRARYVRVSGQGGDEAYAVSEVRLSGRPE